MSKTQISEKEAKALRNRILGEIADDLMLLKKSDDISESQSVLTRTMQNIVKVQQSYSLSVPSDWLLVPGSHEKLAADIGAQILDDSNKVKPAR